MVNGLTIEGKCNTCGGTVFTIPDNPNNEASIACDECGQRFMTWGAYKAEALRLAADAARRSFSKAKGFKPR
jgi:DNA-directed RNA polymerase subunit RPC12/RpoP